MVHPPKTGFITCDTPGVHGFLRENTGFLSWGIVDVAMIWVMMGRRMVAIRPAAPRHAGRSLHPVRWGTQFRVRLGYEIRRLFRLSGMPSDSHAGQEKDFPYDTPTENILCGGTPSSCGCFGVGRLRKIP